MTDTVTVVEIKEIKKKVGIIDFYQALKNIFWSSDELTIPEVQRKLAENGFDKSRVKIVKILNYLCSEQLILKGDKKGRVKSYKVNFFTSKNQPWYIGRYPRPILDYIIPEQRDFDLLYHYLYNNNSGTILEFKSLLNKRDNKTTISKSFAFGVLQIACVMKVIQAYQIDNLNGEGEGMYGKRYIPSYQLPPSLNQEHIKRWFFEILDINPVSWMNLYQRYLRREDDSDIKKRRLEGLKIIKEYQDNYTFNLDDLR